MATEPNRTKREPKKKTAGKSADERAAEIERENRPGMDWRPTGPGVNDDDERMPGAKRPKKK